MRIVMVPGACSTKYNVTASSFCEGCLASFLLHGCAPDRACISEVSDDDQSEVTLVVRRDGQERIVRITDENREQYAFGEHLGIQ